MDQLVWCGRIKNGISLTAPNETLASAYLKKAEEALETMQTITARDWKITTAYYAMYFSLYAVLTRLGGYGVRTIPALSCLWNGFSPIISLLQR
ncbi:MULTISPECIES: hypothetical protein [unclassified Methanoculleus]|jgi:hypothetical protein|uniref:hypothetical protein n=1 Tax=unclassified Methanoculleus TaxID=2619537 RepID=UPI0025D29145|nr:hypothetical protein [Methanoculleus sp. UBA377]